MTKRILALIISLVMVLSLIAGCSGNQTDKDQTTSVMKEEHWDIGLMERLQSIP